MQVWLGVEMSGVRLQAAGSRVGAVFAFPEEKSELSLTPWCPAPALGSGHGLLSAVWSGDFCPPDSSFRDEVGQSQRLPLEQ